MDLDLTTYTIVDRTFPAALGTGNDGNDGNDASRYRYPKSSWNTFCEELDEKALKPARCMYQNRLFRMVPAILCFGVVVFVPIAFLVIWPPDEEADKGPIDVSRILRFCLFAGLICFSIWFTSLLLFILSTTIMNRIINRVCQTATNANSFNIKFQYRIREADLYASDTTSTSIGTSENLYLGRYVRYIEVTLDKDGNGNGGDNDTLDASNPSIDIV